MLDELRTYQKNRMAQGHSKPQMADAATTITSRFGGQQIGAGNLEASLTLVDDTKATNKKKKIL